jgi:pimeloyl-ACP methyl ester carboxylesterase
MASSEIHLTRWGSGPCVVMVHGGAQGSPAGGEQQFAAQRELAQRGFQLVLPDRPGHGRSPGRGREDLEIEAVWVAELLGEGAHLVGHSYGAAISLAAAGLRPNAVWSLTLIEAPVFSAAPDHPEALAFRAQIDAAVAQEDPVEAMIAFTRVAGIPLALLKPSPTPEQLVRMGVGLQQMRAPHTWNASDSIDAVADAGIPALVVTGGWNPAFEVIADELARCLSAQRLVIHAGHHFPHLAAGGSEFNSALLQLLQRSGR